MVLSKRFSCPPQGKHALKIVIFQKSALAVRMAFRRPPPDVDRMTSLRVGNLPYSVVIEVSNDKHLPGILE